MHNMIALLAVAGLQVSPALGLSACTSYTCCNSLTEAGLGDRVHYPGSEQFIHRQSRAFSSNARAPSWCIVQPESPQEVSLALRTLVDTVCCSIGVRGGGHTAYPGGNYIADGVTIDFGNMNKTTFSPETGLASIEPGTSWSPVYRELEKIGMTVPGGRAATVGVAGFLTGGGNSFFSHEFGFGCDAVVNFEVVLADGSIVNANASSNPELWQALKGGSGNLGLVTRFDMKAIPSEKIFGGVRVYANEASEEILDAFTKFAERIPEDKASSALLFWSYLPQMKAKVVLSALVNTDGNDRAPILQGLLDAKPLIQSTSRIATHSDLVDELEQPFDYNNIWVTLTYENNLEMNQYVISLHDEIVDDLKAALGEDADFMTQWALQALSPILHKNSAESGGNILGLDRWDTTGVMWLVTLATRSHDANAIGRKIVLSYVERIKAKARELGVHREWLYINYADPSQDPMRGMGRENLEKLRRVAGRYDPDGVFQRRVKSGFKLPVEWETANGEVGGDEEVERDEL